MGIRAIEILVSSPGAIIRPFIVPNTKTVSKGFGVKHSGADDQVENFAAVGDNTIGIALDAGAGVADTANPTRVRVALWGKGIAIGKVGTGGATRGAPLKYAADGLIDATVGGGTVKLVVNGQAMQSGAVGDEIGVNLGGFSFTVGS